MNAGFHTEKSEQDKANKTHLRKEDEGKRQKACGCWKQWSNTRMSIKKEESGQSGERPYIPH